MKEYHGDRPCIWWPPLLMRLSERGLIGTPKYKINDKQRPELAIRSKSR